MADKCAVKKYVQNILGEDYTIPTVGVYENMDEIALESLPDKFVMKCNHDSGSAIVCRDKSKIDWTEAKNRIGKALKRNYYYIGREWPYKNIKPKVIIEPYLDDLSGGGVLRIINSIALMGNRNSYMYQKA